MKSLKLKNKTVKIVIIIVLLVIVAYFGYIIYGNYFNSRKKKESFTGVDYPDLTVEMETALNDAVNLCFTIDQEPTSIKSYFPSENFGNISSQVYQKIRELSMPALVLIAQNLRLNLIDYACGNMPTDTLFLINQYYLVKVVKSLVSLLRDIRNFPPMLYQDEMLVQQVNCIRKTILPLNDPNIINEYSLDYNNITLDSTYSSNIFSSQILDLVFSLVNGDSMDKCSGVDLNQVEDIIQQYKIFDYNNNQLTDRTCKIAKLDPTVPIDNSSLQSNNTEILPNFISDVPFNDQQMSMNSPPLYDVPFNDPNMMNLPPLHNVSGSSQQLPGNINLINSKGPNNFFLPNIIMS
jgi:hypothetical protein